MEHRPEDSTDESAAATGTPRSGQRLDLAGQRVDYTLGGLSERDAPASPYELFHRWYDEALAAGGEPNAMVVSSVSGDGLPSSRTVLLKGLDEGEREGFVFYTNYRSRKGRDLAAQPGCALLFPWYALQRQVRVEGVAEQVSRAESEAYFASRPRDAQLGAWASPQSEEVPDRQALDRLLVEAARRFEGTDVPCPQHWGGYRVRPEAVEFWQGRHGRMHDRLHYRREGAGWGRSRLAP
jgi:pyridoxamine 5'-phosphate oxidase